MKVWIDQDLCTGDGLCEEICPAVFTLLDDGLAYVKESGETGVDSDGKPSNHGREFGLVAVEAVMEDMVIEAAEECPGECIFIEHD